MRNIPTEARAYMSDAAFMLKEHYADWVWKERARNAPIVPKAALSWPFVRQADKPNNVVKMKRKSDK